MAVRTNVKVSGVRGRMEAAADAISGRRRRWAAAVALFFVSVGAFAVVAYFARGRLFSALRWVESQNEWTVVGALFALFAVVSFPVAIGYLVLLVTSGYLLGPLRGLLAVVLAANSGAALAHAVMRALGRSIDRRSTIVESDSARALLRVVSGPSAFRIVLLARLTPVPFGLQNAVFALGDVGGPGYYLASCVGLLPAQIVNVYLGSTLRSMRDVLHESHVTGYVVFAFQVTVGVSLMVWVVRKAKRELTLILIEAAEDGRPSTSSSAASLIS